MIDAIEVLQNEIITLNEKIEFTVKNQASVAEYRWVNPMISSWKVKIRSLERAQKLLSEAI